MKDDKKLSPPSLTWYTEVLKNLTELESLFTKYKQRKDNMKRSPPNPNMVSVVTSMYTGEASLVYLEQNKKEINWQTLMT